MRIDNNKNFYFGNFKYLSEDRYQQIRTSNKNNATIMFLHEKFSNALNTSQHNDESIIINDEKYFYYINWQRRNAIWLDRDNFGLYF